MRHITVTFTTNKFTPAIKSTLLCVDPNDYDLIRRTINQDLTETFKEEEMQGIKVTNILLVEDINVTNQEPILGAYQSVRNV